MPRLSSIAGIALLTAHFGVRAAVEPRVKTLSLAERLAMLPADGAPVATPVTIHWNDNQIPFVEASSDADLAVGLGVVHAHLRLGQMEMLRRIARGRISEMIGPAAIDLDHLICLLDFGRAVPQIETGMPRETWEWLEGFVSGINHVLERAEALPHEFAVLGLGREPWSVADVLTIGRLVAADVNWLVWFQLLRLRRRTNWPEIRRQVLGGDGPSPYPNDRSYSAAFATRVLGLSVRWASNSVAIAAERSASGAALLANDPHLGIHLPGPWIIAGAISPARHVVGLMPPGLPFFAMGRNERIAWGGTNLMAASSDFVDVSEVPEDGFRTREHRIGVRWWPDRTVTLRDTDHGPVISDARLAGMEQQAPVALRWMGHWPSDEITAMLAVSRAGNRDAFRAAIEGIGVSGHTMTYADVDGHVGKAMAVHLPAREPGPLEALVRAPDSAGAWRRIVGSADLPSEWDPEAGFVVSANERPEEGEIQVGFFFAPPDRARRIAELVSREAKVDADGLERILGDVHGATAHQLAREFVAVLGAGRLKDPRGREGRVAALLAGWDGRYETGSRGALAFELVFHGVLTELHGPDMRRALRATWDIQGRVLRNLRERPPDEVRPALERALARAAGRFERFGAWGGMRRYRLAHPFALVPLFGRRHVAHDFPASGSGNTVRAADGPVGAKRHGVVFGTAARHLVDLSDADLNRFILLGGQDGWRGSATSDDQVAPWRDGASIAVPLRLATVRARFAYSTVLIP